MSNQTNFEWQFLNDPSQDDEAWRQICGPPTSDHQQATGKRWSIRRLWKEGALVLVTTAVLLTQFPWQTIIAAHKPVDDGLRQIRTTETNFFRFHYHQQDTRAVKAVAPYVDRWYIRLRGDFLLERAPSVNKFTINVGNLADPAARGSLDLAGCISQGKMLLLCRTLDVPQPTRNELNIPSLAVLAHNPVGPAGLLTDYLMDWLKGQIFAEAARGTSIQPRWQPMVDGLQDYFWLRLNPAKPQRADFKRAEIWQTLQSLPLQATYRTDLNYRIQSQHWSSDQAAAISRLVTGTVAEYIVVAYGHKRLAQLLAGFARYDAWEKLSPAVFGISARQFETDWHHYLASLPADSPYFSYRADPPSVERARYELGLGAPMLR